MTNQCPEGTRFHVQRTNDHCGSESCSSPQPPSRTHPTLVCYWRAEGGPEDAHEGEDEGEKDGEKAFLRVRRGTSAPTAAAPRFHESPFVHGLSIPEHVQNMCHHEKVRHSRSGVSQRRRTSSMRRQETPFFMQAVQVSPQHGTTRGESWRSSQHAALPGGGTGPDKSPLTPSTCSATAAAPSFSSLSTFHLAACPHLDAHSYEHKHHSGRDQTKLLS